MTGNNGQKAPTTSPALPVWRQVEIQAAANRERVALRADQQSLTYGQLASRYRRLATVIRDHHLSDEGLVAVLLPASPDAVIAMLGTMAAGGAFVNLDPEFPPERLRAIADNAQLDLVLTNSTFVDVARTLGPSVVDIDDIHGDVFPLRPSPYNDSELERLACVYYTSGSTGSPRGVMMPHGPLAHYVANLVRDWNVGGDDRLLQFSSLAWATSGEEIFTCLTAGATLIIGAGFKNVPMPSFLRRVNAERVTILDLPTAFWRELADHANRVNDEIFTKVRLVVIGGESLDPRSVAKWYGADLGEVRLINSYGSTEFGLAVQVDIAETDVPGDRSLIGKPLRGVVAYIDGQNSSTVPGGTVGELAIGGLTVARGYLGDPELTADRFRPDPNSETGGRIFRTRDVVQVNENGDLMFVGRADRQAKIRGHRVDLTEVEHALESAENVVRAISVPLTGADGNTRQYALVELRSSEHGSDQLDSAVHLRALPDYMRPNRIFTVSSISLLANGKKDFNTARQVLLRMMRPRE